MKSKFDFNEIVKIVSNKPKLAKLTNKFGVIRGKSQSENDSSTFAYSVDMLDDHGEVIACKLIFEEDLKATGKKVSSKRMYSDRTTRVRVDPKTGEGKIVDEE